jgi:hypothetical protein
MKRKYQMAHCRLTNSGPAHQGRSFGNGSLRVVPAEGVIGRVTCRALVGLVLLLGAAHALAVSADEYLFTPTVTQGEREIDWHFGTGSSGEKTRTESDTGLAFGIGVTQHWFTALDIEYRKKSPFGTTFDALEWENTLQIGEPGQWPLDLGMVFNVEKPYGTSSGSPKAEPWSVRFGPLLQRDIGKVEVNFNLLFTRFLQGSAFSDMQLAYQSQIKYRYSRPLEVGIQVFGRFSSGGQTWAPYPQQVQRLGPVVLGRLPLPHERSLSYNLAFLMGTTQRSPDQTLRFQVEYEF